MCFTFIILFFSSEVSAQRLEFNTTTTQNAQSSGLTQANDLSVNDNPRASDNASPFDAVKGKREDKSKRDAFSKHYINEDGSFTALICAGPIHYEKNGQFLDIDHTISGNFDTNYPYANTSNLFESYFGATSHSGVKNKTAEGEIKEFLNTQMYWEVNGQAVNTQNSANKAVRIESDKAYYDNIYGNISAEFITLTGKRKLNYIIPNQQALGSVPAGADYLVFTEDVVMPFGWTSTVTESGVLIKDQLGKEIYLYENPVSADAVQDELSAEGNTIFETYQLGNTLTVKTKVKTDWLLSNERVYPVMVDPTVNVWPTAIGNYNTGSIDANGNKTANADIYAGMRHAYGQTSGTRRFMRGWASFNLTSLPTNINITSATFGFYTGINSLYGPDGQYLLMGLITSGIPNAATGATLYNMCGEFDGNAPNSWFTLSAGQPTGNMTIALVASQRDAIVSRIPSGIISLGFRPKGSFSTSYTEQVGIYGSNRTQSTNGGRPYFILTYEEISSDRTLTVSEAYTGASYANGNHTIANNTSVTATSGTRAGYIVTGWTGTGSVPATGTGGTANFTITQNSTINWLWEQTGTPNAVKFYNYGGTEQLAFNNSRIDTNTPTFRMSHGAYDATDYQVEINTNPTFAGGTSWTQTFNGTYPLNTEANFTFNNGFTPSNGMTYYVRARVRGAANVWSAWTTNTYSFTYQTPQEIPDWFQTTQAQFQTNVLSGLNANASHDVVTIPGGNIIQNGSFQSGTANWTISKPSWFTVASEAYGNTDGTHALNIYNSNPGSFGNFSGDTAGVYQTVNMTGVTTVNIDMGYESTNGSNLNVNLEVYISEVSQTGLRTGTKIIDWRPSANNTTGNAFSIDVTSHAFTGNKLIKLVAYYSGSTDYVERYYYFDNVRANTSPQGTITSTPIHLASVQGATAYEGITWNQTLGGGTMNLKVQHSANGETDWTDAPAPYNAITATGNGLQTFDLSGMTAYPHIRLVGSLDGANVTLHDWSVQFQAEPEDCSVETIWDGATWSDNVPDSSIYKIIFEGDYDSDSDPAYPVATGLVGCSVEVRQNAEVVISAGHSVTIDNEITVDDANGASFTVKPDANLVQINAGVPNAGKIIVEQSADVPSNQYNYWAFPVKQQQLYTIYTGIPNNRIMRYNPQTDYFITIPNNPTSLSVFGKGYSIKGPISNYPLNQDGGTEVTATFTGVPNNESLGAEENKITVATFDNDGNFNLIGNPFPSNLDLAQFYDKDDDLLTGNADKFLTADAYFWDNVGNTEMTQQGSGYNQSNYALYNMQSGIGTAAPCNVNEPNTCTTGSNKRPNGIVKPGQGFIVNIKQGETFLTVNNAMRTTQTLKGGFEAVYFKNGKMPPANDTHKRDDKFWLELINSNETHIEIAIGYFEEAEDTFEIYDSEIMSESVSDNLYTLSNDAVKLAINGRKGIFSDEDVIPLGVKFFVNGKYRIQLEDTKGIFVHYQKIYLKDKHLGIIHNLSEDGPYEIDGIAGEYIDRFEIIFKDGNTESGPVLTTASDNHLKINKRENQIEISSSRDKILEVEIFNLSGWSVYKNEKVNSKLLSVLATFFGKQIIVVKVLTETGEIVTKSIINK